MNAGLDHNDVHLQNTSTCVTDRENVYLDTSNSNPQPITPEHHQVLMLVDKHEIGKFIMLLAIPLLLGLVLLRNLQVMNTQLSTTIAIVLSCAFAAIWNGILLRRTYERASTLFLMAGIALMLFVVYAFLFSFFYRWEKKFMWVPLLCWFISIFPLLLACFHTKKVCEDPKTQEAGENNV